MVIDSSSLDQCNGILGNEILRWFIVILDYVWEEVYFEFNKNYDDEFKVDCSGMFVIVLGFGF